MSELSPEAHVAAEAAASAVEELHAREAVEEAAQSAEVTAFEAEARAEVAETAAEEAAQTAEIAVETAVVALQSTEIAEAAHEEASIASDTGDRALQAVEALRAQMEPVLSRYANEEAARVAAMESSTEVQEVKVDGDESGGNAGNSTGVSDNGPDRPARRHGLRRGRA